MTRRQERKRRVLEWAAIVAAGVAAAAWLHDVAGAAALTAALWLGHRRMILPPGVAVLTYHSVARDPAWLPWAYEISVAPETLARHLDVLSRMGDTVMGTRDYLARRASGETLPRTVLFHFDDGYLDNWLAALPLLRAHRTPATFFASLDFIEPGQAVRGRDAEPSGYMNWAELKAVEADPLFEVEPHGVDHGRIPLSERTTGELTVANWRVHAWMQWAATDGPKYDWHRQALPAAAPIGSRVPVSGMALAAVGLRETAADLEARITRHLSLCRNVFEARLGRSPQIFCWPENAAAPAGRRIAASLDYRATTGGRQRNAADEPAAVISRIHMGDRALGVRWLWAEGLHFRAATRLAQGNLYWYGVVGPMNVIRALATRVRRATGSA